MAEEKEIMYESPEAATFKTGISGWVSSTGRYWGKDEHMARWEGSTHKLCSCGNKTKNSYTVCESCRRKEREARYLKCPVIEWDGVTPLTLWDHDKYFFSEEDIIEYCEDNDLQPETLRFMICEPNYMQQVEHEYWSDIFPEDSDGDLPKAIEEKLKELNDLISKEKPFSWSQGKKRAIVHIEMPSE